MAAESPFQGERDNALAAAERLAARFEMTIDEAASDGGAPAQKPEPPRVVDPSEARFAQSVHMMDQFLRTDKARRDAAMRAAYKKGLDAELSRRQSNTRQPRASRARMNPYKHAAVLLRETSLPFKEISRITGLDVYKVVGMKLKMRRAA